MEVSSRKMGATPILGDGTQQKKTRKKKTSVFAVSPRSESSAISDRTSDSQNPRQKAKSKRRRSESFSISQKRDHTHSELKVTPYLEIQSIEIPERVDPERDSYILVIQPVGVRAAGGQYTADEAHEIARAMQGWDWRPDWDGDPKCLPRLEALLDRICKKSARGGEA